MLLKPTGHLRKGQYLGTFSRVGKVYKYLVPERKELRVGEVEDVGKRGQTEGPGPGSAAGRRAQAEREHRDVREERGTARLGGELGACTPS